MELTTEMLIELGLESLSEQIRLLAARGGFVWDHVLVVYNCAVEPGLSLVIHEMQQRGVPIEQARQGARQQLAAARAKGEALTAVTMVKVDAFVRMLKEGHGNDDLVTWLLEAREHGEVRVVAVNGPQWQAEIVEQRQQVPGAGAPN